MTLDEKIDCKCGGYKYTYYADTGMVSVCFKCGRFDVEGFSKRVEEYFRDDPEIILHLIQEGHLRPLTDDV